MANGLNIPVIAEGIENREEYLALKEDMYCRFGQGYWLSCPIPFNEAIKLLEEPTAFFPIEKFPEFPKTMERPSMGFPHSRHYIGLSSRY